MRYYNPSPQGGETALTTAAYSGFIDVVALLWERGANIDAQNNVSIPSFMMYVYICMYVCMVSG